MTTPNESSSLGTRLREAREAAGLTVEQVSASTRIRGGLIRDIESDRFESSGGAVYARGHIRALAVASGVDPTSLVAAFDRMQGAATPPPAPAAQPEPVRASYSMPTPLVLPKAARPERRGPNWVGAGVAAGIVLAVLFAIGQTRSRSPQHEASLVTQMPAPLPSVTQPVAPPPDLTAARPTPSGAELRVRLLGGDSWISVRNAVTTLFEGVVHNGQVKDFRDAKQLRLVVGNAAAVNLVCSGRDLGPAGAPGTVRRFTCSASGIVPA